ncbi:MAG: beta-glucuronidase [Prevotella sp.]|nr:beta-glucuronidase [Prevotella sp.]
MSLASAQQIISLAGAWDLSLVDSARYDDYVMLPGSLLTNGKGHDVSVNTQWTGSLYDSSFYFNPYMAKYRQENVLADGPSPDDVQMKFPFFLTPDKHYVGKAWYRRTVYVPRNWKDQRVTLFLERPHIETTVYVNGEECGHQMSLSTPHRYDVTKQIKFGQNNEIAICVYNGIENVCVGQDSHSVTDQTQGNWNGIVGRIELQAQWKRVNIKHVRVVPDAVAKTVNVTVELGNHIASLRVLPINDYFVKVTVHPLSQSSQGQYNRQGNSYTRWAEADTKRAEFSISLGPDAQLWDEFTPHLYQLTVEAGDDVYETTFGLRSIGARGRQLYLNNRPLFLRGTVENCCFPQTGYPPTDEQEWLRIFRKCKEYGLNHVRFHSYCPPDAAFSAADQVGIYLQPEGPSWPNHGVKLRRGMAIDQYLLDESKRIIDEYGHHPSFLFMAAGNEPAGDWVGYCNDWVKEMKQYDPTKLYAGASVGGGWAWDGGSDYHVKGGARGLDEWNKRAPSSDDNYYSGIEFPRNYKDTVPNQTPIVTHEKGQWCAFPDFKEIPQYTGVYKARNFEIFRDLLRDNGMESQAEKFLMASGRLQTLCYKYEIERNLRTKDYAGFQLLGLNDYSGQGTALVGPLNVFWREKGYVTAPEWREFCSVLVPLARFPKFVYTNNDTLRVPVEAYNAYKVPLSGISATYYITGDSARIYSGGQLAKGLLPVGKNMPLGTIVFPLDSITKPMKLTLTVRFTEKLKNHWDFWVYPETQESSKAPVIPEFTELSAKALKILKKGGSVLLTAAGRVTLGSDVKQTYLPVFWNTSWFKMRPPHTTGAYIDTKHPLFKYGFPTDSWSNLNWWELLNKAQVMNLMELPADYQPPIQPIDTWHVSRKLGMLIEARVGKGRLLMTTMDISSDLEHRPVARQMRQAILSYMQSADFQPSLELTPEVIGDFFTKQAPAVNMYTNDSPDELKPKLTN